jgi:hypothetical protein
MIEEISKPSFYWVPNEVMYHEKSPPYYYKLTKWSLLNKLEI